MKTPLAASLVAICLAANLASAQTSETPAASQPAEPLEVTVPQASGALSIVLPEDAIQVVTSDLHTDLVFHNRVITRFRATVLGNPPAVRAASTVNRLATLVAAEITQPITVQPIDRAVLILVNGQVVAAITDADLDVIAGENLTGRTGEAVENLGVALDEALEMQKPAVLLKAAAMSLGATLVFAFVLFFISRLRRRVETRLMAATERQLDRSIAGELVGETHHRRRIFRVARRAFDLALWTAIALATYLWLTFVLDQFPYTRPWGEALGGYVLDTLTWVGSGLLAATPGMFIVVVIFLITRGVAALLGSAAAAVEAGRASLPGIHPDTVQPTRRLVTAALWMLAIVAAYPYLPGSGSLAFKGVSVFVGIVLSIGSSGIVNQAMSGLLVMYARSLRPGEFVKIGDVEGTVLELGMLSTKIETLNRERITIPNAVVISREATNYSRSGPRGLRLNTSVTIGYDVPWRQVHAMLEMAAERTSGLREDIAPRVLQTELADHYVAYRLDVVVDDPKSRVAVFSELHANIQDVFNEHGVQIMSPHYIGDPPSPKVVPNEHRSPAPARTETEPEA